MVHLSTKELKWVLVNCLLAKWVKCSEYTVPGCGASYSPKITNAPAARSLKRNRRLTYLLDLYVFWYCKNHLLLFFL